MSYYQKLVGERLYLSPISDDGLELYTSWVNNLETTLNLQLAAGIISRDKERDMLQKLQDGYNFSIVLKEGDQLIGSCGLMDVDLIQSRGEMGIFIGEKSQRGKGFGGEAIGLLLSYAFHLLNLHNVMLRVRSFNEVAQRCYRKLGFREIGRRSECVCIGGRYFDEIYMEMLDRDFTAILPEVRALSEGH